MLMTAEALMPASMPSSRSSVTSTVYLPLVELVETFETLPENSWPSKASSVTVAFWSFSTEPISSSSMLSVMTALSEDAIPAKSVVSTLYSAAESLVALVVSDVPPVTVPVTVPPEVAPPELPLSLMPPAAEPDWPLPCWLAEDELEEEPFVLWNTAVMQSLLPAVLLPPLIETFTVAPAMLIV